MITPELTEALAVVDRAEEGPEQVRAAERAVLLADEAGESEGILQARLALVSARFHVPNDPADVALIGWLLTQLDTDVPDEQDRWRILWYGKWAMDRVINIPEVSLSTARQMITDVGMRIAAEGYSERPVAQQWTVLAEMAGTTDERDSWLGRWQVAPRDELADCLACEAALLGSIAAGDDEHEQALDVWSPVISGEETCAEQPHLVLSEAVDSLVRTDHIDAAIAAHQRGWRLTKNDPQFAVAMGRQLMFLVRSGYIREAVDRLLPRLGWQDDLRLSSDRMYFSGIAAAILTAGQRIGATPDLIDGEPAAEAIADLEDTATKIAGRFDDRNGTSVVSEQLARISDPTPYPTVIMIGGLIADHDEEQTTGTDPIELADRLRTALDRGADAIDLVDLWERLRNAPQHQAEPGQSDQQLWRARAYLDRQLGQHRLAEPERARAVLDDAAAAAERGADAEQAFLIDVARIGLLPQQTAGDPEFDARWSTALQGVDEMVATGHSETAAKALLGLSGPAAPEERSALLNRAAELFDVAGDHGWALFTRATAIGTAIDPHDADERLQRIQQQAVDGGHDAAALQALSIRARLAAAAEDPATAGNLYLEADELAGTAGLRFDLGTRYGQVTTLLDLQDWQSAHDAAAKLITEAGRERDLRPRLYGGWLLAIAEQQLGNAVAAAELIEGVLPEMRELEDAPIGQAVWLLGEALAELDEPGAIAAYAEAGDLANAAGAESAALQAYLQAGRQAWLRDESTAARDYLGRVIGRAPGLVELDLYIAAARLNANVTAESSVNDAVAELLGIPAAIDRLVQEHDLGGDFERDLLVADLEDQAADLLAQQGETDAALEHLAHAEELLGDHFEALLSIRADRGRYLAQAGRVDEAAAVLADVLPHVEVASRYQPAAALCNALAAADREDEAQRLWSTYIEEPQTD